MKWKIPIELQKIHLKGTIKLLQPLIKAIGTYAKLMREWFNSETAQKRRHQNL